MKVLEFKGYNKLDAVNEMLKGEKFLGCTTLGDSIYVFCEEDKPKSKSKKDKDMVSHTYGEYSHVRLSDKDIEDLKSKGIDVDRWIKTLDEYLENNKSKKYSNHKLTILKWARKDTIEKESKNQFNSNFSTIDDVTF